MVRSRARQVVAPAPNPGPVRPIGEAPTFAWEHGAVMTDRHPLGINPGENPDGAGARIVVSPLGCGPRTGEVPVRVERAFGPDDAGTGVGCIPRACASAGPSPWGAWPSCER